MLRKITIGLRACFDFIHSLFRSPWTNIGIIVLKRTEKYHHLLRLAELDHRFWKSEGGYREAGHLIGRAQSLKRSVDKHKDALNHWRSLSWIFNYLFANKAAREAYDAARESLKESSKVLLKHLIRTDKRLIDLIQIDRDYYRYFYPTDTPIARYYHGVALLDQYQKRDPREKLQYQDERSQGESFIRLAVEEPVADDRKLEQSFVKAQAFHAYPLLFSDSVLDNAPDKESMLKKLIDMNYTPAIYALADHYWDHNSQDAALNHYIKAANSEPVSMAAMVSLAKRYRNHCKESLLNIHDSQQTIPRLWGEDTASRYIAYYIAYAAYGLDFLPAIKISKSFMHMKAQILKKDSIYHEAKGSLLADRVLFVARLLEKSEAIRKRDRREVHLHFKTLEAAIASEMLQQNSWFRFGRRHKTSHPPKETAVSSINDYESLKEVTTAFEKLSFTSNQQAQDNALADLESKADIFEPREKPEPSVQSKHRLFQNWDKDKMGEANVPRLEIAVSTDKDALVLG